MSPWPLFILACTGPGGTPKDSAPPVDTGDSTPTADTDTGDSAQADSDSDTGGTDSSDSGDSGDSGSDTDAPRMEVGDEVVTGTILEVLSTDVGPPMIVDWNGVTGLVAKDMTYQIDFVPEPIDGSVSIPSPSGGTSSSGETAGTPWMAGDLDGNGSPDLVFGVDYRTSVEVWHDAFESGATDPDLYWSSGCVDCNYGADLAIGDVTGDGTNELLATMKYSIRGFDAGAVTGPMDDETTVYWIDSGGDELWKGPAIHVVDVDGDGVGDVVSGLWYDVDTESDRVRTFLGPLSGTFTQADSDSSVIVTDGYIDGTHPAFADVTGDGLPEMVISYAGPLGASETPRTAWIVPAATTGEDSADDLAVATLTTDDPAFTDDGSYWGENLAAGDMDGDGFAEVAVGTPFLGYPNDFEGLHTSHIFLYTGPLSGVLGPDDALASIGLDLPFTTYGGRLGEEMIIADLSSTPGAELVATATDAAVGDPAGGAIYLLAPFW